MFDCRKSQFYFPLKWAHYRLVSLIGYKLQCFHSTSQLMNTHMYVCMYVCISHVYKSEHIHVTCMAIF